MILGSDLKVGDTIAVWWSPHRATIIAFRAYKGPLLDLIGVGSRIASFGAGGDMTIPADSSYERIAEARP